MKILFKIISSIIVIALLGVLLLAIYTGVDPDSEIARKAREIPVIRLVIPDEKEPGVPSAEVSDTEKSAKSRQPVSRDTFIPKVALFDGTSLYSEPDQSKLLEQKIVSTGKYKFLQKKLPWVQIDYLGKSYWINLEETYNEPATGKTVEMLLNSDLLDIPREVWWDRLIGPRLKKINSISTEWKIHRTPDYVLYYSSDTYLDLPLFDDAVKKLRKYYSRELSYLEFKPEIFTPHIIIIPDETTCSELGLSLDPANGGDYTVGLINVKAFRLGPDGLINAILHEYTHHMNRHLLRLGGNDYLPFWLSEGLAEYFGNRLYQPVEEYLGKKATKDNMVISSEQEKLSLVTTRVHKKVFNPIYKSKMTQTINLYKSDSENIFNKVLNDESFAGEDNVYKGMSVRRYYYSSWGIVDYLLRGENGKHKNAFMRFINDVAESKARSRDLLDYIGFDSKSAFYRAVKSHVIDAWQLDSLSM